MKKTDSPRILVIEDEPHIAEGLKLNLSLQGYIVEIASDGVAGLEMWKTWQPDLIVLDIMLPGIDGLSILQHIRLEDRKVPILVLSAKATVDDRIQGLAYGVDDYQAKPFNLEEFMLRVERLLQRAAWSRNTQLEKQHQSVPDTFSFGGNHINFVNGTANCRRGDIQLTSQEIKLLKLFISNAGTPLSRGKILKVGWGYTGGMSTRTVDNFVVRLRKYFEANPRKPLYFKSIRSVGYLFDTTGNGDTGTGGDTS